MCFFWICRTYADKLSPKVVQSLLDLLCSQLKNLLSQAGVSLLSSGNDQEDNKHEDGADSEKKDFRGDEGRLVQSGHRVVPRPFDETLLKVSTHVCHIRSTNKTHTFTSRDGEPVCLVVASHLL